MSNIVPLQPIVTKEQAKLVLNISGAAKDDVLDLYARAVTARIAGYLGRPVVLTEFTNSYDGDGTATLYLVGPLRTVSSLVNDTVTVTSSNYAIYEDEGKIVLIDGTVFAVGPQSVTVTFEAGWDYNEIPADITAAAQLWILHLYQLSEHDRVGTASTSSGDESKSYIAGMPQDVREMLSPYRWTGFGA